MIDASAAPRIETWVSAMMLSPRETEAMLLTDSDLLMGGEERGEDELEGGEQKGPELLSPDSD